MTPKFLLLPVVALLATCSSPEEATEEPLPETGNTVTYACTGNTTSLQYLFLGHTYRWHTTNRMDERLELLDKSCYDQIWLGGDMTPETTREPQTIEYLDSIFQVGNPETYWAMGNHDIRNGNVDWITDATGRSTYYAHYNKRGFTTIVFNTVLYQIYEDDSTTLCIENEKQLDLLKSVCDTISKSSQLILLMHHVIWLGTDPNAWSYTNHSFNEWRVVCDTSAVFEQAIYPLLRKVQKRGIQVFCIAGDSGLRDWEGSNKHGRYITEDGVVLLASGINNSKYAPEQRNTIMRDKVLVLYHDTSTRYMSWRVHDLDSLLSSQAR